MNPATLYLGLASKSGSGRGDFALADENTVGLEYGIKFYELGWVFRLKVIQPLPGTSVSNTGNRFKETIRPDVTSLDCYIVGKEILVALGITGHNL